MKDTLKSIGFIKEFEITLNCPTSLFIRALSVNTGGKDSPFKGKVSNEKFEIRKKLPFGENRMGVTKLNGVVTERDDRSVISIEANAFNWMWGVMSAFLIFAYTIAIGTALFSPYTPAWVALGILAHGCVMVGIPYFIVRRQLSHTQRDLEKEFIYIVTEYKRATKS